LSLARLGLAQGCALAGFQVKANWSALLVEVSDFTSL